jgi:hypothetical protein
MKSFKYCRFIEKGNIHKDRALSCTVIEDSFGPVSILGSI